MLTILLSRLFIITFNNDDTSGKVKWQITKILTSSLMYRTSLFRVWSLFFGTEGSTIPLLLLPSNSYILSLSFPPLRTRELGIIIINRESRLVPKRKRIFFSIQYFLQFARKRIALPRLKEIPTGQTIPFQSSIKPSHNRRQYYSPRDNSPKKKRKKT